MKILISKSQLSEIILNHKNGVNEGATSPVIIKCHDYDKIENYCSLKYSNSDLSTIYSAVNKEKLKNNYFELFDNILNKIKKESIENSGLVYYNMYTKKFNNNIVSFRIEILNVLEKYSLNVVKAMIQLGPLVDITPIMNEIGTILYNSSNQIWNKNWVERKMVSAFVNKKNINNIIDVAKSGWDEWFWEINRLVDDYYFPYKEYIGDYRKSLNKTTPKCTSVKIIQDQGCNNIKPMNPNMVYINDQFPWINLESKDNIWPKVESLIRSLV